MRTHVRQKQTVHMNSNVITAKVTGRVHSPTGTHHARPRYKQLEQIISNQVEGYPVQSQVPVIVVRCRLQTNMFIV